MDRKVIVVDLGAGNIGSMVSLLARLGVTPVVVASPEKRLGSEWPTIVPGVGHFSRAVETVDRVGWRSWLGERFEQHGFVLGICLGAQLMCRSSEEGVGEGLGWIPSEVRRFPRLDINRGALRVPHIGWQPFTPPPSCLPFESDHGRMYYAHSFYIEPTVDAALSPYQSIYGGVVFAAVVHARMAIGVQFHPEKSHRHGLAFMRRWLQWTGRGVKGWAS